MAEQTTLLRTLLTRANNQCELCKAEGRLDPFPVPPFHDDDPEHNVLLCETCSGQLSDPVGELDPKHWFGLQESIWSETPAVQVMSYRILERLRAESWARDLLDQAYLGDDVLDWARQGRTDEEDARPRAFDSNGTELQDGDAVTLIKDLDVKGTSFVAKRGTLVKGIRLTENPEQVEGKVNNIAIVLKTVFLKKA